MDIWFILLKIELILKTNKEDSFGEITKRLSKLWNELNENEKYSYLKQYEYIIILIFQKIYSNNCYLFMEYIIINYLIIKIILNLSILGFFQK